MKIVIVPNPKNTRAIEGAALLASWLSGQGISHETLREDTDLIDLSTPEGAAHMRGISEMVTSGDLVVCLGGDGTTLRAARLVRYAETPILSLNFGTLGFLSGGLADTMIETVSTALADEITPTRHATLAAHFSFLDESPEQDHFALNEVVVRNGLSGHVLKIALSINGIGISKVSADGMLVATATGSTAYALSIGGPIVAPGHGGMVVSAIAPHTLRSRAIVTDPSDCVEFSLADPKEASVFVDGRLLSCGIPEACTVRRGPGDIVLLQPGRDEFYRSCSRVFF